MIADLSNSADDLETAPVLEDLDRLWGSSCQACGQAACGHELVFSLAMGYKSEPRCLSCLSKVLAGDAGNTSDVSDRVLNYVRSKPCYSAAWARASEREGFAGQITPPCLWPTGKSTAVADAPANSVDSLETPWESAEVNFDAGDMSCGDLVLALRIRFMSLPGGTRLLVTATDPAAPIDIPAWCRLTGHRLLRQSSPKYLIERKRGS